MPTLVIQNRCSKDEVISITVDGLAVQPGEVQVPRQFILRLEQLRLSASPAATRSHLGAMAGVFALGGRYSAPGGLLRSPYRAVWEGECTLAGEQADLEIWLREEGGQVLFEPRSRELLIRRTESKTEGDEGAKKRYFLAMLPFLIFFTFWGSFGLYMFLRYFPHDLPSQIIALFFCTLFLTLPTKFWLETIQTVRGKTKPSKPVQKRLKTMKIYYPAMAAIYLLSLAGEFVILFIFARPEGLVLIFPMAALWIASTLFLPASWKPESLEYSGALSPEEQRELRRLKRMRLVPPICTFLPMLLVVFIGVATLILSRIF